MRLAQYSIRTSESRLQMLTSTFFLLAIVVLQICAMGHICEELASRGSAIVLHCRYPEQTGRFIIRSVENDPDAKTWKRRRFRGRIVGSAVVSLHFRLVGNEHIARYSLPRGTYTAGIKLRYLDFDSESINSSKLLNVTILSEFVFMLPHDVCSGKLTDYDGYWLSELGNIDLPTAFLTGPQPALADVMAGPARYVFKDCRLIRDDELREFVLSSTTRKGALCVVGDSHGRHLSNAMIEFVHNMTARELSSRTDKKIIADGDNAIKYVQDVWGTSFQYGENGMMQSISTCSTLLFNFGQWQLNFQAGSPWPASAYADAVRLTLRVAKRLAGKRVFWLTTHAYSENSEMYLQSPNNWRSDIALSDYNQAARLVADAEGVGFIDLFAIADAMHDLTYDDCHYKSPVERELARVVLHTIMSRALG